MYIVAKKLPNYCIRSNFECFNLRKFRKSCVLFENKILYHAGHNEGAVGFSSIFVNIISKCLVSNYFHKFSHLKSNTYTVFEICHHNLCSIYTNKLQTLPQMRNLMENVLGLKIFMNI